jgi:predicted nucleotidyltransferase component of viral defense system
MLEIDYPKLYKLQDRFLEFWKKYNLPFYLTGGTALGRFYLNHRYSEDLDFFINQDDYYPDYIKNIEKEIKTSFNVDSKMTLKYDSFSRFYINENDLMLKVEFVNDVKYRSGIANDIYFGKIDTPLNILSNKISTIVNRDEPKDMYDIIYLALNYKFNWANVFFETKEKNSINEIEVEQRINSFPTALFNNIKWFLKNPDYSIITHQIKQISNDFITGSDNSLCQTNIAIEDAKPISWKP